MNFYSDQPRPDADQERRQMLAFWKAVQDVPGLPEPMQGALHGLKNQAYRQLNRQPPDIPGARSTTAQALCLFATESEI